MGRVDVVAGFAGSQHCDERRRRRLAVEQDSLLRGKNAAPSDEERPPDEVALIALPVSDLIPQKLWLHLLAGALLLLSLFATRLAVEHLPQLKTLPVQSALQSLDNSQRIFGGLCLLAGCQMCVVIRLIRGRSYNDYAGRYRLWNWITLAVGGMAGVVMFDLLPTLNELIEAVVKPQGLEKFVFSWQVAALSIGSVLILSLRREMRDSRWSHAFLLSTMVCYAVRILAAAPICSELPLPELPFALGMSIESAAATAGHILLMMTFALHARYVIHINPEPPISPLKQFRAPLPNLMKLWRKLPRLQVKISFQNQEGSKPAKQKSKEAKQAAPPESSLKSQTSAETNNVAAEKTAPPKSTAQPQATPKTKGQAKEKPRIRLERAHSAPPAPTAPAQAPPSEKPQTTKRPPMDESPDESEYVDDLSPEDLKGLSKKQRRQLRKQRREAQRAAGKH